jgi:hypothetical protein
LYILVHRVIIPTIEAVQGYRSESTLTVDQFKFKLLKRFVRNHGHSEDSRVLVWGMKKHDMNDGMNAAHVVTVILNNTEQSLIQRDPVVLRRSEPGEFSVEDSPYCMWREFHQPCKDPLRPFLTSKPSQHHLKVMLSIIGSAVLTESYKRAKNGHGIAEFKLLVEECDLSWTQQAFVGNAPFAALFLSSKEMLFYFAKFRELFRINSLQKYKPATTEGPQRFFGKVDFHSEEEIRQYYLNNLGGNPTFVHTFTKRWHDLLSKYVPAEFHAMVSCHDAAEEDNTVQPDHFNHRRELCLERFDGLLSGLNVGQALPTDLCSAIVDKSLFTEKLFQHMGAVRCRANLEVSAASDVGERVSFTAADELNRVIEQQVLFGDLPHGIDHIQTTQGSQGAGHDDYADDNNEPPPENNDRSDDEGGGDQHQADVDNSAASPRGGDRDPVHTGGAAAAVTPLPAARRAERRRVQLAIDQAIAEKAEATRANGRHAQLAIEGARIRDIQDRLAAAQPSLPHQDEDGVAVVSPRNGRGTRHIRGVRTNQKIKFSNLERETLIHAFRLYGGGGGGGKDWKTILAHHANVYDYIETNDGLLLHRRHNTDLKDLWRTMGKNNAQTIDDFRRSKLFNENEGVPVCTPCLCKTCYDLAAKLDAA